MIRHAQHVAATNLQAARVMAGRSCEVSTQQPGRRFGPDGFGLPVCENRIRPRSRAAISQGDRQVNR